MLQLVIFLLIAADVGVLISMSIYEIAAWRARRRHTRIQHIQHEITETQMRLNSLALHHHTLLHEQAHEARKALIKESFRASHEARGNTEDLRPKS
jgi:hypothetical protein